MRKSFKVAAYSYMIILILGFILGIAYGPSFSLMPITDFSFSLASMAWLFHIILFIFSIFAIYGLIRLGKKFKNKFLININYIGLGLLTLYLMYILFGSFFINVPEISSDLVQEDLVSFFIFLLVAHLIYSVIFGIYVIFFGIALLRLGGKIKYAKTAGVLNIVAGATMFIYIGDLVMFVAIIIEMLLLFEASKRFEGKKH